MSRTDESNGEAGRGARRRIWLLLCGALAAGLCLGASAATYSYALSGFLGELHDRGRNALGLATTSLEAELQRFRALPGVVGAFRELRDSPDAGPDGAAPDRGPLNRLLERVADETGLRDLYVLDHTGLTIAASNWATPRSFVGQRYDYRPYFTQAMASEHGRYHALGVMSKERGFYFSRRVERSRGAPPLVVVAKMGVAATETGWGEDGVFSAVDRDGVIFMSNRPALLFRAMRPLEEARSRALRESRQYLSKPLEPAPVYETASLGGFRVLRPIGRGWRELGVEGEEFLMMSRALAAADLRVELLLNTESARRNALTAAGLAALATLLVSALALAAHERRRAALMRLTLEARAKAQLERRVEERTRELSQANLRLEREVGERRAAEAALRRTQAELVQAGKLSALGHLAAGVSHELNQPLAAIRSYAENAAEFLRRDRAEEASANLTRIADLTGRMARIVANLRMFSRREDREAEPISLSQPLEDAAQLLQQRLEREGADLRVELGEGVTAGAPLMVIGGRVRLQQVFTNIVSNALDAVRGRPVREIIVVLEADAEHARARIRDSGPGVAPETRERLFDPYFTTKPVGEGQGLGLSISYGIVRGFGGRILVENRLEGGAEFVVELRRVAQAAASPASTALEAAS